MSSHKPGEPVTTHEAVIRAVLPRNGPKLLSRLIDSPIETARHYYYKHLSAARRREVALALLAEMDEQDRKREALRQHLQSMAGTPNEVGGNIAGATVQPDRRTEAGATPADLGGNRVAATATGRGAR